MLILKRDRGQADLYPLHDVSRQIYKRSTMRSGRIHE